MNNLNTLLLVNEQLNRLKGGHLFLLKCNNNIMQAANTAIQVHSCLNQKLSSTH